MKKRNKNNAMAMALVGTSVVLMLLLHLLKIGITEAKAAELTKANCVVCSLEEAGFYPGRAYGDYSDLTFAFDEYLESIGAKDIQRYVYQLNDDSVFELDFKFDGCDWKMKTTEFKTDLYLYGLYSTLEVGYKGVTYVIPVDNCGTHISDATSPFKCDWLVFDAFHIATDKKSEYRHELRTGFDEDSCPFIGLGIPHYECENDGQIIWHDDLGEFTIDDGIDLHY